MVLTQSARVELYIASRDSDQNQQYFDALFAKREVIEDRFGSSLEWQSLEGKQACRIKKAFETGGYLDEDKWPTVHEELAEAMAKLEEALGPHVKRL